MFQYVYHLIPSCLFDHDFSPSRLVPNLTYSSLMLALQRSEHLHINQIPVLYIRIMECDYYGPWIRILIFEISGSKL